MSRIDEARRRADGSGPDDAQALMPLAALQSEGTDAVASVISSLFNSTSYVEGRASTGISIIS